MRRCGKDRRAGWIAPQDVRARFLAGLCGTAVRCASRPRLPSCQCLARRGKPGCLFDPLPI